MAEWEAKLAPLKGMPIVAYHNSWPYFARRFRLTLLVSSRRNPACRRAPLTLPGSSRSCVQRAVRIVVREPHELERDVAFVANRARASIVTLAASVGALPQASDYFSLFDANVETLKSAAGAR